MSGSSGMVWYISTVTDASDSAEEGCPLPAVAVMSRHK